MDTTGARALVQYLASEGGFAPLPSLPQESIARAEPALEGGVVIAIAL
jgi:hypothetical protein